MVVVDLKFKNNMLLQRNKRLNVRMIIIILILNLYFQIELLFKLIYNLFANKTLAILGYAVFKYVFNLKI